MRELFETLPQLAFCFDWNLGVSRASGGWWLNFAIERGSGIATCTDGLRVLAPYALIAALTLVLLWAYGAIRRRVR